MPKHYKGVITTTKDPKFGFISLAGVTRVDGRPAGLDTLKDIFIHTDDYTKRQDSLTVGDSVVFVVMEDPKRKGGLRALEIVPAAKYPCENGIEIHVDELVIDHPTVPIRWCITPEAHARMKQHPDDEWALVLIAKEAGYYGGPRRGFQAVIGLKNIGLHRGYFTFSGPGQHDLVAYLIRTKPGEAVIRNAAQSIESHFRYGGPVWMESIEEVDINIERFHVAPFQIEATAHVAVEVPQGIFAKPLSPWMKTWLGYFELERPQDECSMRGRIALACTLGVVWYLIWETIKRGFMLLTGIVHLMLGGNPLIAWREAFAPTLSGYLLDGCFGKDDYEQITSYAGWRMSYHPALLVAAGMGVGLYMYFPAFQSIILIAAVYAAGILAGAIAGFYFMNWLERRHAKSGGERMQLRAALEAEEASRRLAVINTYAICGTEPQKQSKSIKLVWTGIKRKVCRAYA